MKFDEFAAKYRKAETAAATAPAPTMPAGEVMLAGRVVDVAADEFTIDINGVEYDIAKADVMDVQMLSAAMAAMAAKPETAEKDKGKAKEKEKEFTSNDIVLFKMSATALVCRRISVPAAVVAAAGMWVSLAPAATEAPSPAPGR